MSQRMFCCSLCGALASICSSCDRGQVYCSADCSKKARAAAIRRVARRYQATKRGAANHAERQRRYRQRETAGVTHQGSTVKSRSSRCRALVWIVAGLAALPPSTSASAQQPASSQPSSTLSCLSCRTSGDGYHRTVFLSGFDPG